MDDSHSCADTVARNSRKATARIPAQRMVHNSRLFRSERLFKFRMCGSVRLAIRKRQSYANPQKHASRLIVRPRLAEAEAAKRSVRKQASTKFELPAEASRWLKSVPR